MLGWSLYLQIHRYMIYIDIYIYIYIYISRAKNIYYILYPYIIICTSCKPPKYFPYTPYKLDIKHLQLHKHCPCRPVVVVVVGWLLVVGCWLLFVGCWLLVVGCWLLLLLLGTLPGHKKEGTIWLGVITAGAVVIPAHTYIYIYILVGGLEHFPIYWDFHHPNWLSYFSYFSEGWLNHQPIYICIWFI